MMQDVAGTPEVRLVVFAGKVEDSSLVLGEVLEGRRTPCALCPEADCG